MVSGNYNHSNLNTVNYCQPKRNDSTPANNTALNSKDSFNQSHATVNNDSAKSTKKKTLLKGLGIAAGLTGLVGAGILIFRGKTTEAKRLSTEAIQQINFSPAKTVQEAEAFAKDVLKIKKVNYGENLEIANFCNEGLIDVHNKGLIMPKKILTKVLKGDDVNAGAVMYANGKLMLNKAYLEGLNKDLHDGLNAGIEAFSNNKEIVAKFGELQEKLPTMNLKQKLSVKQYLENKLVNKNSTAHPLHIIYHELGHHQHSQLNSKLYKKAYDCKFCNDIATIIDKQVSNYAATEPCEFIAETFAGLMSGKQYGDDIIKMYTEYGGIIP